MKSEVIVDVTPKHINIALLEDGRLAELHKEGREVTMALGNIYLAKVKKVMPGLNACFVDVGYDKDGFLHMLDLTENFLSLQKYLHQVQSDHKRLFPISKAVMLASVPKEAEIKNYLKSGDTVLVQIQKEPISTKGPRLTCEISFAGRLLVLLPIGDKVSVSSKIKSSAERSRLKVLIDSIKPRGFSVIVRTEAEGKRASELDEDLDVLLARWNRTITAVQKAKNIPTCVHEESSRAIGLLRDLFNPSFESIHVNDMEIYEQMSQYIKFIEPGREDIVHFYKHAIPIFDTFSVTKQIKTSFGRTVTYKHGAYLIIEQTEAMCVIDVNSGNRLKSAEGQEANALEVNLGAADEIARQMRLRDVGGLIVVDFIDMDKAENRKELYDRMVENMKCDRSRHNILPLSKFCLMEITRQRVRPVLTVDVEENCPSCNGTGKSIPSILLVEEIESKLEHIVKDLNYKRIKLHVHPFVAAFITKGLLSIKLKWKLSYSLRLQIIPDQSLPMLHYKFIDSEGAEINLIEGKK